MTGLDHGRRDHQPLEDGGDPAQHRPTEQGLWERATTLNEDPLAMSRLAAEQDRMMELSDLEGRVTQYWIDWQLVAAAGVPGLILFFGSLFMPALFRAWGLARGDGLALLRLAMMLVGAYLIFAAWPRRSRRGETLVQEDEAQREMRRQREAFHRRIRW